MKRIKYLLLFVGMALFLAACGGNNNENGTLAVKLVGPDNAVVKVTKGSAEIATVNAVEGATKTASLAPGTYTVTGQAVAGFNPPASQDVVITKGNTSTVTLTYAAIDGSGGNGGNGEDPADRPGVYVNVFPFAIADTADITVFAGDSEDVAATGTNGERIELDAGDYTLAVSHADYTTYTEEFRYEADTTVTFSVTLAEDMSVSGDVAKEGVKLAFADEYGADFDVKSEENDNKIALLLASQTEEQVCVTVSLVDSDDNPVRNAPVTVSLTNDPLHSTTWYPGACDSLEGASNNNALYTDGNGQASFVVEATSSAIADFLSEPIKVIASAVGNDGVARRAEFKVFFTNMSHLYYGETDGLGSLTTTTLERSLTRTGHTFDLPAAIFKTGQDNSVYFSTWAYSKQPQNVIRPVGGPAGAYLGGPGARYPGRVVYTLENVSKDEDGNALVHFEGCDILASGTCTINDVDDGSNGEVKLALAPSVDLQSLGDGPVEATVKATYYFDVNYGNSSEYAFTLKDYTFTKQWIGGYLEIDKHVDQHVLTWAGADVTLAAAAATYDSDYVSTVHVTVDNPSQSTIYNVTVRDGVPAELGVVTGSISDGGTYDAINHTVTWRNIPELEALAPGDSVPFTFDVYARHKPGYCWAGGATFNYVVDPLMPMPNPDFDEEADRNLDDSNCAYNDPYLVTNGSEPFSVNAAGYLESGTTGQQHTYYYTPEADESDIWVVRPFFDITKETTSADRMLEGAAADFAINVRQINRLSSAIHTGNQEYRFLEAMYPWEFDWFAPAATGNNYHRALTSTERDNPYARNVAVTDAFEVGLDFTQGIDFDGELIHPSSTKVVGKTVAFTPIASLHPSGAVETATVKLQGNLLSDLNGDPASPSPANNADKQLAWDDINRTSGNGLYAWMNCAYLGAPQLNQPESALQTGTVGTDGQSTIYPAEYGENFLYEEYGDNDDRPAGLWFRSQTPTTNPTGLVTDADPSSALTFPNDGLLQACDIVAVTPAAPEAFLGINVNGEHVGFANPGNMGVQTNTFTVGQTWDYVYAMDNATGGAAAENVVASFTQQNLVTRFNGTPQIWRGDGTNWALATTPGFYTVTTSNAGQVTVSMPKIDPQEYVKIVIPGRAANRGQGQVIYTATYTNNTSGAIDPTVDTTQVQ